MSRRTENVDYLLDQVDTVLILKAETLIKTPFKDILVSLNSEGKYQGKSVDAPENFKAEIYLDISSLLDFIQRGIYKINLTTVLRKQKQGSTNTVHLTSPMLKSLHNTKQEKQLIKCSKQSAAVTQCLHHLLRRGIS